MKLTESCEEWLRVRLWAGPIARNTLRRAGPHRGFSWAAIDRAAENVDAHILRDQRGDRYYHLPPADRRAALRVLDRARAGHFDRFRPYVQTRLVDEAMAMGRVGRCIHCRQIMPSTSLFEGGQGFECDPCVTADL